ncbi:MAG: glycine cleavage system protein H [Elusimicrobia bacterium CG1_02_63_36]|nr:MAG: glycine cleavage system protein H [Elusimicrobia bacterium CG1_02_63_36]PIP83560.1 MAG: glycine cleavage system protein H [Elusimicrobia bacterium CG22_combo_CG10-13_8_21_14_all_63_91]PJA13140.1 MAG: glycine cleavage system protein H [Elusimicrobia bacterium CG_4_10_14_0_2_um_filter_63_34]PJB26065.1 MAG: glycine cleavage system protein H [Elusimicrobia bacterium CG_4_9_14_3_um_filter_62_55]
MPDPKSSRYMKSHEWAALDGDEVVVGVSDHAQHEITDVVFVDLPKAGRTISQGEAVAVVESVKAAFDIYAPVSGEVVAVNDAVLQNPGLVNSSPHDDGWFFRVKPGNPGELDALMDSEAYEAFLKSEAPAS